MSMSIKTIKQDIEELENALDNSCFNYPGDESECLSVFSKLKDDVNEVLETLDNLMCDIKRN